MDGAFVPPWIRPANPVQPFLEGYQIGQRRAALELQAQERIAEQQMQAQRIQEEAAINRERIAATAQARAREQALEQQALQLKAQEAATRMIGLRDMQADVAAGMAEDQAFSRHAWKILGSGAGPFYAAKARMAGTTEDMTPRAVDIEGVGKVIVGAKGGFQVVKPTTAETQQATLDTLAKREQVRRMVAESARLYRLMQEPSKIELQDGETPGAAVGRVRMRWEDLNNQIKAFTTPPATNAPAVVPPQTVTATSSPATQVLPPAAVSNLMAQSPGVPLARQVSSNQPAEPRTQAEFDALPKGALFLNPKDGKVYRKD